jgi:hypothetical protein
VTLEVAGITHSGNFSILGLYTGIYTW